VPKGEVLAKRYAPELCTRDDENTRRQRIVSNHKKLTGLDYPDCTIKCVALG
jgi:hypothetical protein